MINKNEIRWNKIKITMKNQIIEDMINAMSGAITHLPSEEALTNLTSEKSKIKPKEKYHSCWDLLHHLIAWQNIVIQNLNGKFRDWWLSSF